MKILEQIKRLPGWIEQTAKGLLDGIYDKKLQMPHWLDYDVDVSDAERVKQQLYFYDRNVDYLNEIGADYNHLCEFIKACEDKEASDLASQKIKEYAEFITINLESKYGKSALVNSVYKYGAAEYIYYKNHADFFARIAEGRRGRKKKISISKA